MAYAQGKCPNCGGLMPVDCTKKAGVCLFCNEAYINSEAIEEFEKVKNNFGVMNINKAQERESGYDVDDGVLKNYSGSNTNISIPEDVTEIAVDAFDNAELHNLHIPKSVKDIHNSYLEYGFDFSKLEKITVDPENEYFSAESNVLFNKDKTELYLCLKNKTEYVIPPTVKVINKYAFADCAQLKKVVLPQGLEVIGDFAFNGCKELVELNIPSGIQQVGPIGLCENLKRITVPSVFYDNIYMKDVDTLYLNDKESISSKKFHHYGTPLPVPNKISVNGNAVKIEPYAFAGCEVQEINLSVSNIKEIGAHAFEGCRDLVSFVSSRLIEVIGEKAFIDTKIKKMSFPQTLKEIGAEALAQIIDITFEGDLSNINCGDQALYNYWGNNSLCPICGNTFNPISKKCMNCGYKKFNLFERISDYKPNRNR